MKKTLLLLSVLTAASLHAQTAAPAPAKPPEAPYTKGVTPPDGANLATFPVLHPGTEGMHNKFNEISKKGEAELVYLGDSITAGWSGRGKDVWAKYYGPMGAKAANFGIGGDRTEHVLWRLDNGNFDGLKPKLVVLMIGTNNTGHQGRPQKELNGTVYHSTAEETAQGVKAILDKLKAKCPGTKVLLLAIFPRGANEMDRLRKQNEATNDIIKGYADDKTVFFMDIGPKFLQPDGTLSKEIMPDLLHPNDKGYEIWASAVDDKIKELMK
jgi:lysophospholipase L1-like esterase